MTGIVVNREGDPNAAETIAALKAEVARLNSEVSEFEADEYRLEAERDDALFQVEAYINKLVAAEKALRELQTLGDGRLIDAEEALEMRIGERDAFLSSLKAAEQKVRELEAALETERAQRQAILPLLSVEMANALKAKENKAANAERARIREGLEALPWSRLSQGPESEKFISLADALALVKP